ncbi:hypothetical protein Tco_1398156, partial [Tanacetum coccineum]
SMYKDVRSLAWIEFASGVDDPAETMQNVGVRNMSKCQVIIGSRGEQVLTSVTSPEVVNYDDKTKLGGYDIGERLQQSKESLFSFGAPIFGQVKDETSIKSQDRKHTSYHAVLEAS